MRLGRFGLIFSLLIALMSFPAMAGECLDLIPPDEGRTKQLRYITAEDLLGLRDIGPIAAGPGGDAILAISPDGSKVAFQLRRADTDTNSYCQSMLVVDIDRPRNVLQVNVGGEFIVERASSDGFADYIPVGTPAVITPKWSPDGNWIAFLRRDRGATQVWRAKADGTQSEPVTNLGYDAEDFFWSADGDSLIVSGRPETAKLQILKREEGRKGFLFDDRFAPASGPTPMYRGQLRTEFVTFKVKDKSNTVSEPDDVKYLLAGDSMAPADSQLFRRYDGESVAWISMLGAKGVNAPTGLHILRSGKATTCVIDVCNGIVALWWATDGSELVYLRRQGWRNSELGLYRISTVSGKPRTVLVTDDLLIGCQLSRQRLVCAQESSLQPRRLVTIDLESGIIDPLFDPNPDFKSLRLGPARRLQWTNKYGVETYGDLVLPPDHQPGQRHPLVVVGYESKGFLRGGTGDEYPIQLFAVRGYAVLSFQRPFSLGYLRGGASWDQVNGFDLKDWADRRSVESSLEVGVSTVVKMGVADPKRVGITGVSDGASTGIFALINSRVFSAAALSSCCQGPVGISMMPGPTISNWFYDLGYPKFNDLNSNFWKPVSLRQNASNMDVPLLLQLSDDEYLYALEDVTALREASKPVEMYIFPDEHHIKWQPTHRAAVYERSLDWFDFWLLDRTDPDAKKAGQYARWKAMRASLKSGGSSN